MQKVHCFGTSNARYFWNVKLAGNGSGEYRSRHSTAAGVRGEFSRNGQKVIKVTPARA